MTAVGTPPWLALLRGIDVGGATRLPMQDPRSTIAGTGAMHVEASVRSGDLVLYHS